MTRRLLVPLIALAVAAVGCAAPTIDDMLLLDAIPESVLPDNPELLQDLECPSPIEVGIDVTVDCTASIGGDPVTIEVRQTDDQGAIDATLAETLFDVEETAAKLGARFSDELDIETTVDCGEPPLRVLEVGMTLTCNAADAERSREVVLTVSDETGAYDLELGELN